MICENCGKNTATTYIKRVINGVATQKHLCSICAAKYGFSGLQQNSFANILSTMFGDILSENEQLVAKSCGSCGITFSEIVESGKVGCPECYKKFYSDLLPYLKRVHGSVNHIGKVPNNAPLIPVPENRLTKLRQQLNDLVLREEFETAAKVRDEIKELEKEETENG